MSLTCETRRAGGATGLGNAVCLAATSPENSRIERPPQPQNDLRLKFLASRLHALGPKPIYHFLYEIEAGADIRATLEVYAALPAEFIRAHGGDRFAPPVHLVRRWQP